MSAIQLYLAALPVFILAILLESYYFHRTNKIYSWKITGSNLVMALAFLLSDALTAGIITAVNVAAYEFRPFDIPNNWTTWIFLFFLVDFSYYWMHRFMHENRWMWALHSVHHSAQQITFSVAYRLGWTKLISGAWLFFVPVSWIGFDPRAVTIAFVINQLYQFWLHTETVPKLGFLEKILNTPSHHRVHHATNPEYLDRNYTGVFIFWDKMFGTFEEEKEGVQNTYGLIHQVESLNPLKIAFAEYIALFRDLQTSRSWRDVIGYLWHPPGWRHDGTGVTSEDLRRAALAESSGAQPAGNVAAENHIDQRFSRVEG